MRTENGFSASIVLVFLCQWLTFHPILSLSSYDSIGQSFDRDADQHQNRNYPPHLSSSSGEESPALHENNELPVSEGEDEHEEDVVRDPSSPPVSSLESLSSANLFNMNQDARLQQAIDARNDGRFWRMMDDPLERSSSRQDARHSNLGPSARDLFASAAARHQQQNGLQGFFQYARQPAKGAWEFGYRRGNNEHFTERHEHGASHHVKAKIRWGDKYGGYGEHYYDYNHKGIGEEMPAPQRQRQPQPRVRGQQSRYAAASHHTPQLQEWPH